MRLGATICLLLVVAWSQGALALSEAKINPPDWPAETTYEFAIKDQGGQRVATAYYRIIQDEADGRPVYRFKYTGSNEQMSEASECWVERESMLPLRSTRKVVSGGRTFYQDVAYDDGVIIIRRKYEGEAVAESKLPGGNFYDYEELVWLIPQLDFGDDTQVRFNIFATLSETPATIIVTDLGTQPLAVLDHEYQAHAYSFDVNLTPYSFFTVEQEGRWVPARIDMGYSTFINMSLEPAKVGQAAPAPPPPAPPPSAEEAPPEADDADQGVEEEPPPSDPHVNPLGPPPPGGRF